MNKNLKLLGTGLATLFWFKGMYRILDLIIPDDLYYSVILVIIALSVFYYDDGELNELGKNGNKIPPPSRKVKKMNN